MDIQHNALLQLLNMVIVTESSILFFLFNANLIDIFVGCESFNAGFKAFTPGNWIDIYFIEWLEAVQQLFVGSILDSIKE